MSVNLIPHGKTPRQIGALVMWARRRDVYAESRGYSPDGLARLRKRRPSQTHCKRGHKFRPGSFWLSHGTRRSCNVCQRIRRGQRKWSALTSDVRASLRAQMIAAHPDKGGTAYKFTRARAAYLAARKAA